MGITAIYTVFCDECPQWYAEEPRKADAVKFAKKAGFVRRRTADGTIRWLCPVSRDDVCGETWSSEYSATQWCLAKPLHEGFHVWR